MLAFVTTCPQCNTKDIALRVVHSIPLSDFSGFVFLFCPNCGHPSSAMIAGGSRSFVAVSKSSETFNSHRYELHKIWPEVQKPKVPASLPENVTRAMMQAESNFVQADHEEASAVMYRKALELGLKTIAPELGGMLAGRIEALGKAGKLTPAIVEWAKEIKNLGNDGAHELDSISREELSQLRGLTDMTLQYLFTIPAMVQTRRSEATTDVKQA